MLTQVEPGQWVHRGRFLEAQGLPPGVSASFSPNPTSAEDVVLTLSAFVDAPLVSMSAVTIKATPRVSSAGLEPRNLIMPLTVATTLLSSP